jgi:uncharacterized membrane protein HdeD (DUF308 family)
MAPRRKITGGLLAVIGFMLSPLSWWNDAFVNLPLAVGFAWLVSYPFPVSQQETVFPAAAVTGYWLTNLLGFILLHHGTAQLAAAKTERPKKSRWQRDLLISLAYTGLIVVLLWTGVLKPIAEYFPRN